jgi:hypothetical protein
VKQDVYDVKVYLSSLVPGANLGYKLTVHFTNSKYDKPVELLDPNQTGLPTDGYVPPDFSPDGVTTPSGSRGDSGLTPIDAVTDSDIAGVGLGVNEQFNAPPSAALGQAREVSATKSPSGLVLVVMLGILPAAAGLAGVLVVRRRRRSLAI